MRKGFTLIELLAVIVILAIIALIATPIILGIINDAKEDSNKRSVENYAHAVELAVARYAADKGGKIPFGEFEITSDGKQLKQGNLLIEVDYKGEKMEGKVTVLDEDGKEGQIKLEGIKINGGNKVYNYSEKDGVTKNESSEGGNTETSSPFKVTKDGVLIHYERQGNETSVKIPAEVNGIKIKEIAPFAFLKGDVIRVFSGDNMILIVITEIPKELEDMAIQNNAEIIMIDDSLKRDIEFNYEDRSSGPAKGCSNYYGGELTLDNCFENVSNFYLTDVDLSEMIYLEKLNPSAFSGPNVSSSGCSSSDCKGTLKSVKLPMNGVLTTIGDASFDNNQLTEVIIPASVTTIGDYAFSDNNITTAKILGDSSRFDSVWSRIFDSTVQKVAG